MSHRIRSGSPVISVIVPVRSDYDGVSATLNALAGQDISEPFEILVSTERSSIAARTAEENHSTVRLILGKRDRGPGGNRNRGIEAARGTYLAFIDADVVPEKDWLSNMLAALRRSSGRPVCGWNEIQPRSSWLHLSAHMADTGTGEPRRARQVPGRFILTICRLPYCRLRESFIYALMSPVVLLHLTWYAAGFSRGARMGKG